MQRHDVEEIREALPRLCADIANADETSSGIKWYLASEEQTPTEHVGVSVARSRRQACGHLGLVHDVSLAPAKHRQPKIDTP